MSTALLLAETEPDTRGFLVRHLVDDGFDVLDDAEPAGARPDLVLLGDPSSVENWAGEVPVIVLGREEPARSTASAPSWAAATTPCPARSSPTSRRLRSAPCCRGRRRPGRA